MKEEIFEKLGKSLKRTASTVGQKTDLFVEIQKIRSRQHALEDSVAETYQEIGKKIYERFVADENMDEELETLCQVIARLLEEVEVCQEEIAAKKGEVECPNCGAKVPKNARFCMKCGNAMISADSEDPEEAPASDESLTENEEA